MQRLRAPQPPVPTGSAVSVVRGSTATIPRRRPRRRESTGRTSIGFSTALRAATIGEYDVAGELGRGGMAVVFLAHDLSLNRKVAIKALLPELLYTEGMDRRFKHEARIAAKLDHPNILVIHSVREANDLLYIVMKLVEGLATELDREGRRPACRSRSFG